MSPVTTARCKLLANRLSDNLAACFQWYEAADIFRSLSLNFGQVSWNRHNVCISTEHISKRTQTRKLSEYAPIVFVPPDLGDLTGHRPHYQETQRPKEVEAEQGSRVKSRFVERQTSERQRNSRIDVVWMTDKSSVWSKSEPSHFENSRRNQFVGLRSSPNLRTIWDAIQHFPSPYGTSMCLSSSRGNVKSDVGNL